MRRGGRWRLIEDLVGGGVQGSGLSTRAVVVLLICVRTKGYPGSVFDKVLGLCSELDSEEMRRCRRVVWVDDENVRAVTQVRWTVCVYRLW